MFQIEPVLWLQSLESPTLTWLMSTTSLLGYSVVYGALITILIFGVRLKTSFYIFLAMLISGILTDGLKRGLAMPRPSDVDIRVIEPGKAQPLSIIDGGGATSFWSLPSAEAMAATKNQRDWSYGFPSGHVAAATAFFLGLAFFFRSKRVLIFSIAWIILIALSRMYLGRHFIADVLGGMGVGIFTVALAAFLVRPLEKEDSQGSKFKALIRWAVFVIPLVLLAPFVELLDKENIGRMLGVFVAYAVLLRIGMPSDKAKIWKRVARVLLAFLLYALLLKFINPLIESSGIENSDLGIMTSVFLISFVPFIVIVLIAKRLKLYESPVHIL